MFNGERVRQARELKAITQERLGILVGVSQAAITQVENGICQPTEETIAGIAKHTSQPAPFFFQPTAPEFPLGSLLFRSHTSMTRREMVTTSRYAQYAYDLALRMLPQFQKINVNIPRLEGVDPAKAAKEARRSLGVSKGEPVPHLLNLLEWCGTLVFCIPPIKSRDAFSRWFGDTPVIALGVNRAGDHGRLSAAHELGHLVLHPGKSRLEVDDSEADQFSEEFLMPKTAMQKELIRPVVLSSLAHLKVRWKVPMSALIRRARDLGFVTDRQYRYLHEQLSALRLPEPVPIDTERPRMFRQMIESLYGDPINYRAFSAEMSVDAKLVTEMIHHYSPKLDAGEPRLSPKVIRFSGGISSRR